MYQRTYSSQRWETHNRINQLQNMTDCYHHWKPFLFLIYLFWYPKKKNLLSYFSQCWKLSRKNLMYSKKKCWKYPWKKNSERIEPWPIFYAVKTVVIDARKIRELLVLSGKSGIVTSTKLCSVYLLPKKSLVWKGRRSLRRLFRWIHL